MRPETPEADLVRRFLADRDEPCPGCGYNLRGVAGIECPECQEKIRLGVIRPATPNHTTGLALAILLLGGGYTGYWTWDGGRLLWGVWTGSAIAHPLSVFVWQFVASAFFFISAGVILSGAFCIRRLGRPGSSARFLTLSTMWITALWLGVLASYTLVLQPLFFR